MAVSVFPGSGKSSVFPVPPGGAGKAEVSATTGSPAIDTTTRSGKTIYKFTANGSITVSATGTAEILVVGGGGAASMGGGGAGGFLYNPSAYLEVGTLSVTVGAGGPGTGASTRRAYSGLGRRVG